MSANPATPEELHQQIVIAGLEGQSIFDLDDYDSGSKITHEQFLLLRVLWIKQDQNCFSRTAPSWIPPSAYDKAKRLLKATRCWKQYLQSFQLTATELHRKQFPDLGTFSLVRYCQCEVEGIDMNDPNESSKVTVTPVAHRTRSRAALKNLQQGPSTPTPKGVSTPGFKATDVLLRWNTTYSDTPYTLKSSTTKNSDILTPWSPIDLKTAASFPPTPDEQIVNSALVLFLKAVTIHFVGDAYWSDQRMAFNFADENKANKAFEARVDGVLINHYDRQIMAILEVKPYVRGRKEAAIQRQEAAQMAAWISSTSNEADEKEGTSITRILISQDRHEIYLTFATFGGEYVKYVTGKANANVNTVLRMNQFGPFVISNVDHMRCLAYYILAIALNTCTQREETITTT